VKTYLGLDYGKRRIGMAVGDDQQFLAFALSTHVEGRDGSILDNLRTIISERNIETLVLGLPLTASGEEGEMAQAVRKFGQIIETRLGQSVVFWDERYSSAEADRWLVTKKKSAKEDRDALAAEIILQSYLDHLCASDRAEPSSTTEQGP